MARKSGAALKSQSITLPKVSKDFIESVRNLTVPPGTERKYEAYLEAVIDLEEKDARAQVLADKVDKMGTNDPDWGTFDAALHELQRAQRRAFAACDGFVYACKTKDSVPEGDLRAIISDSLSDKLDELCFTSGHKALAGKIVPLIIDHVKEGMTGDPVYCEDCG